MEYLYSRSTSGFVLLFQVVVYDIKTKQVKQRFEHCPAQINQVECTAKDTHIIAGLDNGEIRIYSNTTKQLTQKFVVPKSSSCTHLRCHYTKRHCLFTGSNHGIVALFDINVKKAMYVDAAHVAPVTGVAFSPKRYDVVVTSGRDRKLVYHDVVSRKRIAEVNLENSITALDFAPDGIFLIAGFQNGNIKVFDTRNIEKPMHCFEPHSKEITNVFFQKPEGSESNTSIYTIGEDMNVPEVNLIETTEEKGSCSFDYSPVVIPEPSSARSTSLDAGDSFMAALGQFENDSPNPSRATIAASSIDIPLNDSKKIERQSVSVLKKVSSSTPKCFTEEAEAPELSPVISLTDNRTCQPLPVQQTTGITEERIREIIRDELDSCISAFKREMQEEMFNVRAQVRRNFLDLHMAIVKEFIQVEDRFTNLRQSLEADDQ